MLLKIRWPDGWRLRIERAENEDIIVRCGTTEINLSDSELNEMENAIRRFRENETKKEE